MGEEKGDEQDRQHERERRPEWPVPGFQKLVTNQVADQHRLPSAEQLGNDEVAHRGNENEDATGQYTRNRQRKRHGTKHPERT